MEEEFELLESTFRKAGFREVTTCILESYFTSICSIMNVYNQMFINLVFSIWFLSQSGSNLVFPVFFDKISFDQRVVHQCIGKDTHKCISH